MFPEHKTAQHLMGVGNLTNGFFVVCCLFYVLCVFREALSPLSSKKIRGNAKQSLEKDK